MRFRENAESRNVIEEGKPIFKTIKGHWNSVYFQNEADIVLELACGYGEYTVGLARIYSDKNFIGIDIKGARIWKGSSTAMKENLENVAFLRTQIDHLDRFFAPGEVSEIWITFPDPRPKKSDAHRRLTSPKYLEVYKKVIRKGGIIHLKTDDRKLHAYTVEQIAGQPDFQPLAETTDLYNSPWSDDHFGIKTRYEGKFTQQGIPIKYLCFKSL